MTRYAKMAEPSAFTEFRVARRRNCHLDLLNFGMQWMKTSIMWMPSKSSHRSAYFAAYGFPLFQHSQNCALWARCWGISTWDTWQPAMLPVFMPLHIDVVLQHVWMCSIDWAMQGQVGYICYYVELLAGNVIRQSRKAGWIAGPSAFSTNRECHCLI